MRQGDRQVVWAAVLVAAAMLAAAIGCRPSEPPAAAPTSAESAEPMGGGSSGRRGATPAELLDQHGLKGRVTLVGFGSMQGALSRLNQATMTEWSVEEQVRDLAYLWIETPRRAKDVAASTAYFKENDPGFPVQIDPTGSMAQAFGVSARPAFFLVDKAGRIRYRGPLPEALKLMEWGEALLAEQPGSGVKASALGLSRPKAQQLVTGTTLPNLDGTPKTVWSHRRRCGLVVVFADTTCPFAGEAIGDLARIGKVLKEHEIGIVLVNLGEPQEKVLAFFRERSVGVPVLYDVSEATQKAWQVDFVPTVMLFDSIGVLRYRGKAVWDRLGAAAGEVLDLENSESLHFEATGTEYG